MKKIYLIPNTITAFGLACGLFVIFKITMLDRNVEGAIGTYEILQSCVIFLLIAALADLLDGAVARIMHAESEFGLVFDSLADAVSFGVAPSVLLIRSLELQPKTPLALLVMSSAMLFSICAILRLVRYNVTATAAKGDDAAESAQKKNFTGLPIDAGALSAISAILILNSPFVSFLNLTNQTIALILSAVMLVLGYFMVSPWKFPSLKTISLRKVPAFQLVFFTVLISLFLLYGAVHFFPVVFFGLAWSYLILAWTLSLIRLIAGRKSKTLEDFEPEDDEDE